MKLMAFVLLGAINGFHATKQQILKVDMSPLDTL
jgi:hypothetical protein